VSESRRHRRKDEKNKREVKSNISRKDKIIALIAITILFILAVVAAYYYSLSKSGMTLF